jgi:hypothetical protein
LQTALDARQELATQLSADLASAKQALEDEKATARQRTEAAARVEAELREKLASQEKALQSTTLDESGLQAELERARAALSTQESDAETKLADAKRKLTAAETKIQLLQKEIMNIVSSGSASEAAASVVAAEDQDAMREKLREAEKKILDLELKVSQSDTDTRKRLRESEYRVCELEFKLAEAEERLGNG